MSVEKNAEEHVSGTVRWLSDIEIALDTESDGPVTIAKNRVSRATIGQQTNSAAAGAKWGIAVGAVVGLAFMFATKGGDENDYWPEFTLLPCLALGPLVGLGIGALDVHETFTPVRF